MALTFKGTGEDNEEEEEEVKKEYDSGVSVDDEDKIFRTRGFKGNVKASLNRAPRTLSSSSLRTRKRMEALMRRAREFMKKDKSSKKPSSAAAAARMTNCCCQLSEKLSNRSLIVRFKSTVASNM